MSRLPEYGWDEYLEQVSERPGLFTHDNGLCIVLDRAVVEDYQAETGRSIGIVYKSPYHTLVVDLVLGSDGNFYPYERLLPAAAAPAVVVVPVTAEGRFVLLRQFRHATRSEETSFPRGFGERGLNGMENAAQELYGELCAQPASTQYLGCIAPDSGSLSSFVLAYLCEIGPYETRVGYEGIRETLEVSEVELDTMIAEGDIVDGFTLSAWSLLKAWRGRVAGCDIESKE